MSLAATEVRLQLDDRVPTLAADPPNSANEEALEAFGEVRSPEELFRIVVLGCSLPDVNLPEVGREFGLLVPAARDICVWRDHIAPRLQASRCRALDQRAADLLLLVADCSSKVSLRSSSMILSISSAWGAEIAVGSREAESSARSASRLVNRS